ncbi:MAG: hypothetical protein IJ060_09325 [Oscillospiraceae bacterium]|nr:hypothetical protein [Oscillospiraceae bacterium]
MAQGDFYNLGLTGDQVKAALQRALTDMTDSEIRQLLSGKQDTLTIDSEPTAGSDNPVRSGGVVNYTFGAASVTIPSGANLNTYTTPGSYRCESNAIAASLLNCPTANGFRMEVISTIASESTGYQRQHIYPNNNDGVFYMRRRGSKSSRTWGDWYVFRGTAVQAVNVPSESV